MSLGFLWWYFFSLFFLLMFYNFKLGYKNQNYLSFLYALIFLPTNLSFIQVFHSAITDNTNLFSPYYTKFITTNLGLYLNRENLLIIFSAIVVTNILTFFFDLEKHNHHFIQIIYILSFIILSQCFWDFFISFSILSIGWVFIFTFYSIYSLENSQYRTEKLLLTLSSNSLIIIGALLTYSSHKEWWVNYKSASDSFAFFPSFLIFAGSLIQTSSSIIKSSEEKYYSLKTKLWQVTQSFYGSVSSLLIISWSGILTFQADKLSTSMILTSSAFSLLAIYFVLAKTHIHIENYLTTVLSLLFITILTLNNNINITYFVCILTLIFPLQILLSFWRFQQGTQGKPKRTGTHESPSGVLRVIFYTSNFITSIVGALYGKILIPGLPKILVNLLQTPLRIFYNGNLQRSILFALLALSFYMYFWEII